MITSPHSIETPEMTGETPAAVQTPPSHRSGFIALIGRPNVGKSSLLNRLAGQPIAIASPVMQTTRHRIRGVLSRPEAQLVLLDTPGFSKPIDALGTYLVEEGQAALNEADILACVMDITSEPGRGDAWIVQQAAKTGRPLLLVLNKVDRLRQNPALYKARTAAYQALFTEAGIKPKRTLHTSARTGKQREALVDAFFKLLPLGPRFYGEDDVTDQRLREMVAELIREQVLHQTADEVPHSVAVGIDVFDESDAALTRITATLYVNRKSQLGMLVGKAGSRIKAIGSAARVKIEALLEKQVFLDVQVKLRANWRKDDQFLKQLNLASFK